MKIGIFHKVTNPIRIQFRFYSNSNWYNLKRQLENHPGNLHFPNQTLHHDPNSNIGKALVDIVNQYEIPGKEMGYAFGYGSKVFSQGANVDISNSQIDMMFITKDDSPMEWHRSNISQHSNDYSSLSMLGPGVVNMVGKWGAGVYFNPFVDIKANSGIEMELKYGVTSMEYLCSDLLNWDTLYLAGRMHKPIAVVVNDPYVSVCQQINLTNAIRLAIIMTNKPKISKYDLFMSIASVSYLGDPRLKFRGENPNKVRNIVDNQYDQFDKLYSPVLSQYLEDVVQITSEEDLAIDVGQIPSIVDELPGKFVKRVSQAKKGLPLQQKIVAAIEKTVESPAIVQSIKGVVTAGVIRSWRYAKAKRLKYQQAKQ